MLLPCEYIDAEMVAVEVDSVTLGKELVSLLCSHRGLKSEESYVAVAVLGNDGVCCLSLDEMEESFVTLLPEMRLNSEDHILDVIANFEMHPRAVDNTPLDASRTSLWTGNPNFSHWNYDGSF